MPYQLTELYRQDKGSFINIAFQIRESNASHYYATNTVKIASLQKSSGTAQVRFKIEEKSQQTQNTRQLTIPLMISSNWNPKIETNDTIKLRVTSTTLDYCEEFVCTKDGTDWLLMGKISQTQIHSIIEVSILLVQIPTVTFANLFDDEDLTDFYLGTPGDNRVVAVHKACLAAHSDVFKAMLSREWKETGKAQINLQGTTFEILESLKKYIYLGILPDDDKILRQLLIFASCYMMESLKAECIYLLCSQITGENLHNLIRYASDNKIFELTIAIMEQTPNSVIKIANEKLNE